MKTAPHQLRRAWAKLASPFWHGREWQVLSWLVPIVVLLISLMVAQRINQQQAQDVARDSAADFAVRVRETVGIFQERMANYQQVLRATQSLFSASDSVDAAEFSRFIERSELYKLRGLQGIGYAQLKADQSSEVRYDVSFNRPAEPFVGMDFFAQPSRRPAWQYARDTGLLAISNKLPLPDENPRKIAGGYQMVLPIYRNATEQNSLDERAKNLQGWVYARFSMDGLIEGILGERPNIAISILDGSEPQTLSSEQERVGGESDLALLIANKPVEIGAYQWTIVAQSLPNLAPTTAMQELQEHRHTGWLLSVILALLSWLFVRWRMRVLRHESLLQAAKADAEHANLAKSKFLAAASHDLRQPIHALCLFLDVLGGTTLNTQQQKLLAQIRLASDATNNMLNTLLDFSRIEAGAVEARPHDFALQKLFVAVSNDFQSQAASKGLRYRMRNTRVNVYSDPMLLEMMLRNLVSNALRYTPRGGILLACRQRGNEVIIEVWDSGIGIAPEHQETIFHEFQQLNNPERNRDKGMGLGLAIVQGLARTLDHPLTLRSRLAQGSVFRITVPLARQP
ncbi:MAG: CHASE domain-containing protein [Sideroxydans sp.]|nr:CHASE domain-containing protein [Sideroxydans sp.]